MTSNNLSVFSLYYAAPISYYAKMFQKHSIIIDLGEYFRKGTYRNRCSIAGANGILTLSIPLQKGKNQRTPMGEVKISYDHPWQKIHWDSLCAAYRRSPFFEYYEDDFKDFYKTPYSTLSEFNLELQNTFLRLLGTELNAETSSNYMVPKNNRDDYRMLYDSKSHLSTPRYMQVFEDRNGFLEDLSIFDLLFNKGNRSLEYLLEITNYEL